MSAWKTVNLDAIYPTCSACYAVYVDSEVAYVGSTECLATRLHKHGIGIAGYSSSIKTPWGWFGNVVIKYRPSRKHGDWAMVELRLIKRIQPKFNRRHIRARRGTAGA
jgi:hypothetical protein